MFFSIERLKPLAGDLMKVAGLFTLGAPEPGRDFSTTSE
jgi:hypothetical protein